MPSLDNCTELRRLQMALEAISTELDVIEGRPHASLRLAAEELIEPSGSRRLHAYVDKFAVAMNNKTS